MAGFNKFAPKSQAKAPAKEVRKSLALKMKGPEDEKSTVLCFVRETTSKKNPTMKFFIGEISARDEEGNIIKNEKGWAEGSGTVAFVFKQKKGDGVQLLFKGEGDGKAELICNMDFKPNDKGSQYVGKDDAGNCYYLDLPLPKK